jgi:hypothetical protein
MRVYALTVSLIVAALNRIGNVVIHRDRQHGEQDRPCRECDRSGSKTLLRAIRLCCPAVQRTRIVPACKNDSSGVDTVPVRRGVLKSSKNTKNRRRHWCKKKGRSCDQPAKKKNEKLFELSCAIFAQGAYGTDAKRQQHQGTSHYRCGFWNWCQISRGYANII